MFIFLAALSGALAGVLPLILKQKFTPAIIQFGCTLLVGWWLLWLIKLSTVWPLFGWPGLLTACWWLLARRILIF